MDKNRRNFIKFVLVSGGVLMAGKILGPLRSLLSDPPKKVVRKAFKVVENKKGLSIRDSSGEEILQIDGSE